MGTARRAHTELLTIVNKTGFPTVKLLIAE
jgi:hypothetical protein